MFSMDTLILEAIAALGDVQSAQTTTDVISRIGAAERCDDPPFRHYLSASQKGVSLLFENGRLLDVQVAVEPTKSKASCPLALPFGLARGMRQADVHRMLGQPAESDQTDSRYYLHEHGTRLFAAYDSNGLLRYLSFEHLSGEI